MPFLLTLTVSNTGASRALGTYLSPFGFGGPAPAILAGPLASTTSPLGSGEAMTFSWTCAGTVPGPAAFSLTVTAEDEAQRGAVWCWAGSAPVRITRPAGLAVSAALSRTEVSTGQWVVLRLTVTNTGEAPVEDLMPSLVDRSVAVLHRLKGPNPAGPVVLEGGRVRRFAWGWLTRSPGGIALFPGLAGIDGTSGTGLACTVTVSGRVLEPPVLTATIKGPGNRLNQGQRFGVEVTVLNEGEAGAVLRPPLLRTEGQGRAAVRESPPAESVTLTGGASRTWAWRYEATGVGPVAVYAEVAGRDVNTGQELTAPPAPPAAVAIGSAKMGIASCFASPAYVDLGDVITVYLTVANTGPFILDSVSPRPLQVEGDGVVAIEGGPLPVAMTVAVGAKATFMWKERALAPGHVAFKGTAVAWDGTGSPEARTNGVTISKVRKGTAKRR
jgi:hypothetical protein